MRILRVNETKRPCTNDFLVDSFSLESWKVSGNEEKTLFFDSMWSLGFSLNPEAPHDAICRFIGLILF